MRFSRLFGTTVRRLRRDLEVLRKSGNPQILVRPAEENLLEWHFLLHSLPDDTPYSEGCYHGKVIFPSEYPHAPPAILMMTPSGRLETRKRLCLSMTDFHPESWNPAWSVETILVGLLSFFISEERGYGSMSASREERVRLARQSRRSNAEDELFRQLFPEYVERTEADSPETCGGSVTADAERPETAAERAEDAEDLEAANSRRPSVSEGSEGVAECWICRDVTGEPLIQPCRCRGSMSGVHASCVEEWIRRHRRSARDDAPPRCSVCHQPYQGSERVPGVRDFVSHNCRRFRRRFRTSGTSTLLSHFFQECAMDGNLLTPLRALGVTFVALVTIYRLWVLFVSLPQHRAPPQHWLLQRLFVPGQQELAKHLAEAMSFVTAAGLTELGFRSTMQTREVYDSQLPGQMGMPSDFPRLPGEYEFLAWEVAGFRTMPPLRRHVPHLDSAVGHGTRETHLPRLRLDVSVAPQVLTVWVIAGLISWPFAVPYAVAAATLAAKLGLGRCATGRATRDVASVGGSDEWTTCRSSVFF
ncbi:unnamed protein product [Durusdinium trenchii]|uniref:Uncharacterized protein n=1 Tax=Durusdinium trenchii TaxID=1381693 RepID=A0ABP0SML7_9DINO